MSPRARYRPFVVILALVAALGATATANEMGRGIDVRTFGARGDGVTDDTAAIQRAVDSRPNGGIAIYFPSTGARYLVTDTIRIRKSRVNLVGDGQQASIIHFTPRAPGALFQFADGKNALWQCSISHLGLTGDNAVAKIAIEAIDVRIFTIDDVAAYPWTGGARSIGIHLAGREFIRVLGAAIHADAPLVISPNPNSTLSLDQSHFEDSYFLAAPSQPVITIESGATLSNVTFDGAQAWVRGTHGLYWKDSETKIVSANVVLANVRREQADDAHAYVVYVATRAGLQNLEIRNLYGDIKSNGIFLSNCWWSSIEHFIYPGHFEALNASKRTNHHIIVKSSFFQIGSTIEHTSFGSDARGADNWVDDRD